MFEGHDPKLVVLSVLIAIMGGYSGFGLAARVRAASGLSRRLLLAGAAGFLALGIWTMHFVGMMAAPIPADAIYLVLPTIVSFLICALVVGVSLFFVSIGEPSGIRVVASALLLGAGIVSMHYVGIHGLAGRFRIEHDPLFVLLSVLIAIVTAYGGLRLYLTPEVGRRRLAISAAAFGLAVSGMHYTAMWGMIFEPIADMEHDGHVAAMGGTLAASPQALAPVVAFLCFIIVAGFLLFLVPEPRQRTVSALSDGRGSPPEHEDGHGRSPSLARLAPLPLGGLGQPQAATPVARIPVAGADGTHFLDVGEVRSIRADAHYTWVHDGHRERMCSWPISEVEAQLDPSHFLRVHRSHIVSVSHVSFMRKEGDGAVVELDGPVPHLVPVSRARVAELRARLGLSKHTEHRQ